ncbi:MAG: hypothetical protein QXU11_01080 [Thermoproteota archaeon]
MDRKRKFRGFGKKLLEIAQSTGSQQHGAEARKSSKNGIEEIEFRTRFLFFLPFQPTY